MIDRVESNRVESQSFPGEGLSIRRMIASLRLMNVINVSVFVCIGML